MKLSDGILIRNDPALLQRVEEMAPDFWWLEGYFPGAFFGQRVICNVYLIKDGRNLLLVDNGISPVMQEKILALIARYYGEVDSFYMTLTQGHLDHAGNNEVIDEVEIEDKHFILNEREMSSLEYTMDWLADLRSRNEFYPWMEDISPVLPVAVEISRHNPQWAEVVVNTILSLNYPVLRPKRELVEPLRMADVQPFTFGSVTLEGWPLGRLVILPDNAHSPGHCSVYDPEYKIMLCGDVTVEINPVLRYSSVNGLVRTNALFRRMAEEGYIEKVGDGHRSRSSWGKVLSRFPSHLRDEVAEGDYVVGKDDCIRFFTRFEDFHRGQRQAVVDAHARVGNATVPDIAEALLQIDTPAIALMKAMHSTLQAFTYPWRMLCLNVALEQGCKVIEREGEGGLTLLEPSSQLNEEPRVSVPWRGI